MKIISIWKDKERNEKLASIYSGENGRSRKIVALFLHILYEISDDYNIISVSDKENNQTDSDNQVLKPAHYYLDFKGTKPELKLSANMYTLFPSEAEEPNLSTLSLNDNQLGEKKLARSAHFRFRLAQRDRTCVVTNSFKDSLISAHVIPHEWSKNLSNLPDFVRFKLGEIEGGLGALENGLLMDSTVHTLFDKLYWSVVEEDGKWKIVALSTYGQDYEGLVLRFPEGKRNDEVSWKDLFPPKEFFEFHLRCAVFKHCLGKAEENDPYFDEDYEVSKVLSNEYRFLNWVKQRSNSFSQQFASAAE